MGKGLFVVLEGIDNCGKTTQAALLKKYFEDHQQKVIQTREPGGTKVGEEIRNVLLKVRDKMIDPLAQTLLFYASRKEFLNEVVIPNIKKGVNVITDRFYVSTFVYQGYVQKVDEKFIEELNKEIVFQANYQPDLYIIIDIPAKESVKRSQNNDRKGQELIYEKQGIKFLSKLEEGYRNYAKDHKEIVLINGMKSKQEVFEEIIKLVINL